MKKNIFKKRKFLIKRIIIFLVFLCVTLSYLKDNNLVNQYNIQRKNIIVNQEIQKAIVEKVIDGDTIKVKIESISYRVRLIGIDAPESVHPDQTKNTERGKQSSKFVKSILNVGQTVYLQKDQSDEDRYGRLLRYVWLIEPKEEDLLNEQHIIYNMLNAILINQGYAVAKAYKPDILYQDLFEQIDKN